MMKILLLVSLVGLPLIGLSQIKKQPEPKFNFDKTYAFGVQMNLNQVPQLKTSGILEQNPFAYHHDDLQVIQTKSLNMPILHPELSGFKMPIKKPETGIDYSLLIQRNLQ